MRTPAYTIVLLLVLAFTACDNNASRNASSGDQPADSTGQPEKFVPYTERLANEEKALRARLRVREMRHLQPSSSAPTGFATVVVQRYDAAGNMVREENFTPDGGLKKAVQNTWQGDLLIESVVTSPVGQSYRATYQYDAQGNKLHELLRRPSGDSLLARSYVYDAVGNEVEARLTDRKRKRDFRKVTRYDAQGRPASVQEFEGDSLTWEEIYTIEDRSWTVTRRNHAGEVLSNFLTEFDADGRAIRIEQQDPEGQLQFGISYVYNAAGRLSKESQYRKDGIEMQSIQYSYREDGLKKEQLAKVPSVPQGALTRFEYEFAE